MGKLTRRRITISISETWTLVWTDTPATGEAGGAGEGENASTHPRLLDQSSTEVTDPGVIVPAGGPASRPDGEAMNSRPSDQTNRAQSQSTGKYGQQRQYKRQNVRGKRRGRPNGQAKTKR